jgi:uncharacterized protein YfeS
MDLNGKDNKQLVLELLTAFNSFKQKLEDPNYMQMESALRQMMEGQKDMREDISELKRQLLNPFDGVIVETRKNTEYRENKESMDEVYDNLIEEHKSLMRWKSNMQKVFVALGTSAGAVITWLISTFFMK